MKKNPWLTLRPKGNYKLKIKRYIKIQRAKLYIFQRKLYIKKTLLKRKYISLIFSLLKKVKNKETQSSFWKKIGK